MYDLDLFTGMPICKGRVTGKARVVKTLEEANSIQVKGHCNYFHEIILICVGQFIVYSQLF